MSRLVVALPLILTLVHSPALAAQTTGPALASRFELPHVDARGDVAPAQEALLVGVRWIDREPTVFADVPAWPVVPSTARLIDADDDATIKVRHRFALLGGIAGAAAGVAVATRHDDDLGEAAFLAPLLWSGYAFVGATFGVAVGAGISFIVRPPRHTARPIL
jgi:hypothetical protein